MGNSVNIITIAINSDNTLCFVFAMFLNHPFLLDWISDSRAGLAAAIPL